VNPATWTRREQVERTIAAIALVLVIVWPATGFSTYWSHTILLETFIFGMAAASLVFLSAYGGMVSLAQTALFGISGIILGNVATKGGPGGTSKGLHLGWDPTVAVIVAIVLTTIIGLIGGAVASRSAGIYFLMITLTYSVIAVYVLGQVTNISGFSGIGGINRYTPGWIDNVLDHPNRLYYIGLGVTIFAYVVIRYLVRTPFGLSLQGVRDEPVRAASLGYNVPLHRTLAFGFAAFVAAMAGVLYAWFAGQVSPGDVDLPQTISLLIMAVIGGLTRIEGAWIGAFVFFVMQNYVTSNSNWFFGFASHVPGLGFGGALFGGSFNTIIGIIFLAIVVVSPDGLMGLWGRLFTTRLRSGGGDSAPAAVAEPAK
jgi:branched-chain amino acid transport system permease protein